MCKVKCIGQWPLDDECENCIYYRENDGVDRECDLQEDGIVCFNHDKKAV